MTRRLAVGISDAAGLFLIIFKYLVSSVNPAILNYYLCCSLMYENNIKIYVINQIHNNLDENARMSWNHLTSDLIQINNTSYYLIVNKATNKALYLNHSSSNYEKQIVGLQDRDQEILGQVWMLVQVSPTRFPNMYQIVHTISTLALTSEKDHMQLKPGKWKSCQLYFLQRHDPKSFPNQFWIKDQKQTNHYLNHDPVNNKVSIKQTNYPDNHCIWQISLVHNNQTINRSCYIQYAYSNMVLDVPKASDKPGVAICQYPCNNRFNQRWNLIKVGENYRIQNLKTGMCLDIKAESKKPGTPIIQWKPNGNINQLWKIEYQGKNIYMIRSAMDPRLYMCVNSNSLKECADVVTTNDDNDCFWRIVGFIPE